jgi:hypothetical protein
MNTRKNGNWDLTYHILSNTGMNINTAYRNKATYKGGRGTWDLRCFETWTFDIKVTFLVVLKCKKIKKCILPCENFNFVIKISRNFAKFRNISLYKILQNFVIFRNMKFFRKIKKLFRKIRNKYFAIEKIRRPP